MEDLIRVDRFVSSVDQSKIVLSARCVPSLKQQIFEDAEEIGVTSSELIESRLINFNEKALEVKKLTEELRRQQEKISSMSSELTIVASGLEEENRKLKQDNEALLKYANEAAAFLSVFNEPKVQHLFQALKGKQDQIELPDGSTFVITYNSVRDLTLGMIHSFEI